MDNGKNRFNRIVYVVCCIAVAMAFSVPLMVAGSAQAGEGRHVVRFGASNDKVHEMRGFKEEQSVETPAVPAANNGFLIAPPPLEAGGPPPAPIDISKPGDLGFYFHYQRSNRPGILTKYHKNMKVMRMEKDYLGIHMMGDEYVRTRAAVGFSWNLK